MKKILSIVILYALPVCFINAEPQREKGLSLHMLPKRVAEIDNKKWGFVGDANNNKEETFQTSEEVLAHFKSLPSGIQDNGIWVVITHPDAYSEQEKQTYEHLKQACLKNNITLLACRASKLPDGWIKGNLFSIANCDATYDSMDAVKSGWDYFKRHDLDAALEKFKQAEKIDPNFAPAYFGEAYVYSMQKKLEPAINSYKKSIEKDPTHSDSYTNLGLALIYSGKPDEGLPLFEKAVKLEPDSYNAYYNWGNALLDLAMSKQSEEADKLFSQAVEKYQKATEIKPDMEEAYSNWGGSLMELAKHKTGKQQQELFERAKIILLKIESIKPSSSSYNLACIAALQNQKDECKKWLKTGEQFGNLPTREEAEKDDDLKSVREEDWFKQIRWSSE
jgi:tetratricopeptide (TPR) repeat protein